MKKILSLSFIFLTLFLFSCSDLESSLSSEGTSDSSSRFLSFSEVVSDGISLSSSDFEYSGGIICKKNIVLSGKISKSLSAKKICIQMKWAGEDYYQDFATAEITSSSSSEKKWSCNLSFSRNSKDESSVLGVACLKIVALDLDGKHISDTEKNLTLFIDENAELAPAWKITRNSLKNIDDSEEYFLSSKSELKNRSDTEFEQNTSFKISLNCENAETFAKNYTFDAEIFDENGEKLCDLPFSQESSSLPEFLVTQKLLQASDSTLSVGKHFLSINFLCAPVSQAKLSEKTDSLGGGFFIWNQESDIPTINCEDTCETAGEYKIKFFDDDAIKDAYFALLSEDEYNAVEIDWDKFKENPSAILKLSSSTGKIEFDEDSFVRSAEAVLKSPEKAQSVHLLALVRDKTDSCVTASKELVVKIISPDEGSLIITSPDTKDALTFPGIEKSAIVRISGYTLDKKGFDSLKFYHIKDISEETVEKVKETLSVQNTSSAKLKVWDAKLSAKKTASNGFYNQNFSLDIDIFADFEDSIKSEAENSYNFLALLSRKDGTSSYQIYTLPEIQVSEIPVLKKILITSGYTAQKGDTVVFQAEFSSPVAFENLPDDLNLNICAEIADESETANNKNLVASYLSGSGTSKITFGYEVSDKDFFDISSAKIDSFSPFVHSDLSDYDFSSLFTVLKNLPVTEAETESRAFYIDGIPPVIEDVELSFEGGVLSVVVTASEKIIVTKSPSFELISENSMNLTVPYSKYKDNKIIFSKKIEDEISDNFTFNMENCIKKISSITDIAGNKLETVGSETKEIFIDTIPPKILSMIPEGETSEKSNVFKNGNKITLLFSEDIKLGESGEPGEKKIILRQTEGWPIPAVLTESEFNLISSKIGFASMGVFVAKDKNGNPIIDSESIFEEGFSKYPNDTYHGTGQYIGPYKKTVQSIGYSRENQKFFLEKNIKYILDFDMGIWETDEVHYYAQTFENSDEEKPETYKSRGFESHNSKMKIVEPAASESAIKRTANQIRRQLENAHYHERVIVLSDKNSLNSIKIDAENPKKVTVTFGENIFGKTELEDGREWELLIDEGVFTDLSGNSFFNDGAVLNLNGKQSFFSDGVEKPVVRVDRYSYGLGIWQADENGNRSSQIKGDSESLQGIWPDSISPTGFVRVRIDCATKDASIKYASVFDSLNLNEITDDEFKIYESIFAGGNGDYKTGCKNYIVAFAEKEDQLSSDITVEGILQTTVKFSSPKMSLGVKIADLPSGLTDLSVRGLQSSVIKDNTFPLRKELNGSPYLRRAFREKSISKTSSDYYWLSYEILSECSLSTYTWSSSLGHYDWDEKWQKIQPGELNIFSE